MCRKNSTNQNRSLVKVWKKLFLMLEIGCWLYQRMIFVNTTKIAFSSCVLISKCRVMLQVVPDISCKLYQTLGHTLINILYMYNIQLKYVGKILWSKKEASSTFKKSFFGRLKLTFGWLKFSKKKLFWKLDEVSILVLRIFSTHFLCML